MTNDHLVHRVQREFHGIITGGFDVPFAGVPSHVGFVFLFLCSFLNSCSCSTAK